MTEQPGSESRPPEGYALATPYVPPVTTGLGIGGLVSGIGSMVMGLIGCCWWPLAVLPLVMGMGAVVLGYLGIKEVAGSGGEVAGRSIAVSAIVTGVSGVLLTLAAVLAGLLLRAGPDPLF